MTFKNRTYTIILPVIFSLLLIIGILIGNKLSSFNNNNSISENIKFDIPKADKLSLILDYINKNYVDSVSIPEIEEKAIPEILKQLDPHSVYIPKQEMEEVNEPLVGNFDGIGIQFNIQKDTIVVINTISGGPSEKVGLRAGDRIVKVNDTLVAGIKIKSNDVVKKLKGPSGTKVKVAIKRRNSKKLLNFEITRGKIPLYSVDVAYMITDNIGYIKISKFASTTYDEFLKAIKKLKNKGLKKIILDLRGNGGGFLNTAINVADEFLPEKKTIVFTKGRNQPIEYYKSTKKGYLKNTPTVILIDEWSASASEIVTGAIQDNDRGIIIGRRSFGKGLVQEPVMFKDGSGMRLTIARYYTPTGRCIQKPYTKGYESYELDIGNRFLHGEFTEKDSIHFPDSLKYKTPKGKTVYGGGGIMPDIFIPIDTSSSSKFLTEIINQGLIYKFAFNYTDTHRKELNKFKNYKTLYNHLIKTNIFNKFIDYCKTDSIEIINDYKKSKKIITNYATAYISRNILNDKGFYPILNFEDKTVQKAIEVLTNDNH